MKNFFRPSSFKITLSIILVAYIFIGIVFLASLNSPRSNGSVELSPYDKAGMVVSYSSIFLVIPLIFVTETVFLKEKTVNEVMIESGCLNCTDERFDEPISSSTPLGYAAGILTEIFLIYSLSCLFSFLRDLRRNRV
jgi:hypothetical protein